MDLEALSARMLGPPAPPPLGASAGWRVQDEAAGGRTSHTLDALKCFLYKSPGTWPILIFESGSCHIGEHNTIAKLGMIWR